MWRPVRSICVYVETCPQYLLMDESKYMLPFEEARHYMIAPPLRKKKNQEILWQALKEGRIHTIATDHCSFTKEQKMAGAKDFSRTRGERFLQNAMRHARRGRAPGADLAVRCK